MRKWISMLSAASLCLGVAGFAAYAAQQEISVTNRFETGIVDIHIQEYQKNADEVETLWVDRPTVLPGESISKIPRITCDGNDCYIRCKITIRGTTEITEDDLYGISADWVKADDGYYYYTAVVPTHHSVDLFEGITIPTDLSDAMQSQTFWIDIDAEAIQSKNFTPDFTSDSPWKEVDIERCQKEGQYDISSLKGTDSLNFEITYEGDSKQLLVNQEDFFENFPYLMPGDTYSDSVTIQNQSGKQTNLYFRTEMVDDSKLLEKITLSITYTDEAGNQTLVYEGTVGSPELQQQILFKVKWIFSTEEWDSTNPGNAPSTGDSNSIFYVVMLGMSLGGVTVLLHQKKKQKSQEKSGRET